MDRERALHNDEYANQSSSISLRVHKRAITRHKAARERGAWSIAVLARIENRREDISESDDSAMNAGFSMKMRPVAFGRLENRRTRPIDQSFNRATSEPRHRCE